MMGTDAHYAYRVAEPTWFRYMAPLAEAATCKACGLPIPDNAVVAECDDGQLIEERCAENCDD